MHGSGGWRAGEYFAFCGARPTFRPYRVKIALCAFSSSIRICNKNGLPGLRKPGLREKACGLAPIIWLISLYN